ncbi:MAG: holo-ACP synthase [Nanoarchaeota archaeon]
MYTPHIKIGIDIVKIDKVEKLLIDYQATQKVFHPGELQSQSLEHIAGIFAAKEAFFKALEQTPDWLGVMIEHKPNGKPRLSWSQSMSIIDADVSISHDADYAVASVMLILPNKKKSLHS